MEVSETWVDNDEGSVHISHAPRSKCVAWEGLCEHAIVVNWESV